MSLSYYNLSKLIYLTKNNEFSLFGVQSGYRFTEQRDLLYYCIYIIRKYTLSNVELLENIVIPGALSWRSKLRKYMEEK